jgi:hypothetical protein
MQEHYTVTIEKFAERHFIKSFDKKYGGAWEMTLRAVVAELERIDMFLQKDKATPITVCGDEALIKTEFKIAGSKESAKSSGNRCIVYVDHGKKIVRMLLVYGKTDLPPRNETAQWRKIVKEQFPELVHLCQ